MAILSQDGRTKVVIRRLPPKLDEQELRTAVDALCEGKYDWYNLVQGKIT